jgi:putative mRNA 3-end processing factor
VTEKGAILLGRHVACDAYEEDKPIRVVTHIHADHLLGLRQSLKKCEMVMMTPITKDLIDVMKNPLFLMAGNVKTLDYKEELWYDDEKITLRKFLSKMLTKRG